jgi:hypothetical protein
MIENFALTLEAGTRHFQELSKLSAIRQSSLGKHLTLPSTRNLFSSKNEDFRVSKNETK